MQSRELVYIVKSANLYILSIFKLALDIIYF